MQMLNRPKALYFMGLFTLFMYLTYVIQNMRFRGRLTESRTGLIMMIISVAYMFISVQLIIGLGINFVLGGVLNLFTVSYLLKAVSYAHVLNNVRTVIEQLNSGDEEEFDSIPSKVN